MDDDFGGSLTPPVSPCEMEGMETDVQCCRPPCFSCTLDQRDGGKPFSPHGYLASGSLNRLLLRLDPSPTGYEADTVDIFGFQWVTEMALVESPRLLFGLLRQQISHLEDLAQTSSCDFGNITSICSEADDIRQQCVNFLQYIKVFIFRYLEPSRELSEKPVHPYEELEVQLPSVLVEELHALTLFIGHLRERPSNILANLSISNQGKVFPPSWHLVHLHLDIQWSVLEILHILGEKTLGQVIYAHQFMNLTGQNLTNVSLFEDHCNNLLRDLMVLAVNKCTKVRPSDVLNICHYQCSCVKELWTLLIHLLDHRNKTSQTENFWSCLNNHLRNLLQEATNTEGVRLCDATVCKDPRGFSWWLITHLAILYTFDRNGTTQDKKLIESNWSFTEELLKLSVNVQNGILEEQLRMHLQCCLTLCDLWHTNLNAVTILWEYYSKHLNSPFNIPWLGLQGLASVSKSPFAMLEMARTCCSGDQSSNLYESQNSFQLFLRILALQITKGQEASGTHPWKQLKGRIYSKFHQRKMQELTELGLQNFLSLFLVLAEVAGMEDVVSRVSDLLDLLKPSLLSTAQQSLIWKGYFAFILMYEEKNVDISFLATKMSVNFENVAKEFYLKTTDHTRKATLWPLLLTYIESVQEVFETSSFLHLSEEKLLNEGFDLLYRACRESELNAALTFLQIVLARLRSVHKRSLQPFQQIPVSSHSLPAPLVAKERHLAIASALWRNFFPFVKSQRLSQTPSSQTADVAAGFTLLAMDMPSTAPSDLQPQPLVNMMQIFGWDDMVHPQLVSRYLSHLIQNSSLVDALKGLGCSSYQTFTIHSWFRCILQQHLNQPAGNAEKMHTNQISGKVTTEQLAGLTRIVCKLPEMENLLNQSQLDQSAAKVEPKTVLFIFIKAVGKTYSQLQTLGDKSSLASKALEYAGDILKYTKPYLVNKGPNEGLQLLYWAVGCIVKHWALILATSKTQQLLFRIIDRLLLPHTLFQQGTGLPPAMLSAIRDNLPLYLQGLAAIIGHTTVQTAYVKQLLQNIIHKYFDRFLSSSPTGSGVVNHPILLALCELTPVAQHQMLRKTVVLVISESYMQFRSHAPPPRLAAVLSFLLELLRRNQSSDAASEAKLLLPTVLKCLMLVNEPQVKKFTTELMQCIIENCQSLTPCKVCPHLTSILRQFIQEHFGIYDHQVYNIIEMVAVLNRDLVISLIPTLSQTLKDTEHKQGLGRNNSQRESYRRLLVRLGEEGQAEIIKLENDSD
ncbi:protein MMS22-like isoform X2 [Pristis pectinata]|uniref:protein MMS22-like isoform X2 n=1 Tax=Pristis pectinata TaxID=685728 RepID=UPI00223D806F|nr:protein MMS22-like isoform X2 [Pristis pectinata]XP_051880794.1 protein MMS22-like isoform X2 [Pristis pectinata]